MKPDLVINIGDAADMPSLSPFEKGKKSFAGLNYKKDIYSHLDFQERLWSEVKKQKKKLPWRVFLEGGHEHRIILAEKGMDYAAGTISFDDLELDVFYDEIVGYRGDTPGVYAADGLLYAHYFVSGIKGQAGSSENQAAYMLGKAFCSVTQGHTHMMDWCIRTKATGPKIMGACVGCYIDYICDWAGEVNKLWDRGVLIKRNVEDGCYDPEWVSMATLKKEYGN